MRKEKMISEVLGHAAGLTPSDLYNTEFKSSLVGGYDKNDVDTFLERVADEFEALLRKTKELSARIGEQEERIKTFEETEGALRDALTSAQRYSEDLAKSAQREADALLEEARLEKIRAEVEAAKLPEALRNEIEGLKASRNRLREDLMAVLETHHALAENIPAAEVAHADEYGKRSKGLGLEDDEPGGADSGFEPESTPLTVERAAWPGDEDDEDDEDTLE